MRFVVYGAGAVGGVVAARLVHSADESVPVADLELGVQWLLHAARSVCA